MTKEKIFHAHAAKAGAAAAGIAAGLMGARLWMEPARPHPAANHATVLVEVPGSPAKAPAGTGAPLGAATPPAPPEPPEPDELDSAPPPAIERGVCGIGNLLPQSLVRDVSPAETRELAEAVHAWIHPPAYGSPRPLISYRRGVVFVESEEDRGDDGPYPRSAAAEGQRVCGSSSTWLRSHLREQLETMELTCCENLCTYPAMAEGAPAGVVAFHFLGDAPGAGGRPRELVLDAWVEVHQAALGPEYVDKNIADTRRWLARLDGGSCRGEPDGYY